MKLKSGLRRIVPLSLIGGLAALAATIAQEVLVKPGTKRMAERLESIAKAVPVMQNPFLSRDHVGVLKAQLAAATNGQDTAELQRIYATELLNAGDSVEALNEFNKFEAMIARSNPKFLADNKPLLRLFQATCYLRMAEQKNCLLNHSIDSCLLPIRNGGVHKFEEGSRGALGVLTNALAEFPNDLSMRWLLNIASMTLGEYPDKVPPQWVIPPARLASEHDIGRFYDVAGQLRIDLEELSGGVVMDDFDNDGFLDLMTSSIGLRDQMHYFRNNGDGTFSDRTREAGLTGECGGLNMIQADYNNDGFVDVLVLRGGWMGNAGQFPASLLRNNGDGTFEDVTEQAGLLRFHPTQTAVWLDFNGDGWIDLFIGNESIQKQHHPCELFLNNGDGTFTECATACGVANVGFVKAVVSGDFNNDGRPDLYLSRLSQKNVLYRNDGPKDPALGAKGGWKFTDVAAAAKVTEPLYSFPAWFFDYDNDGWQDIFVSGYRVVDVGDIAADVLGVPGHGERPRLYHNNHDGTFSNVTEQAHLNTVLLSMGSNFGDLDNDGWLDFYVGTGNPDLSTLIPNRTFRNAEGRFFQDVTTSGGFGQLQKGHAIAFGDIDNDGDQDVYADLGGAVSGDVYRNSLYLNPGHGNNWLTIRLQGVKSNRSAIGARVRVVVESAQGERSMYKTVGSGGSFGASPLRQEFGLGKATVVKYVEVFWPATGQTEKLTGLEPNHAYTFKEGSGRVEPLELKRVPLKFDPAMSSHATHHP